MQVRDILTQSVLPLFRASLCYSKKDHIRDIGLFNLLWAIFYYSKKDYIRDISLFYLLCALFYYSKKGLYQRHWSLSPPLCTMLLFQKRITSQTSVSLTSFGQSSIIPKKITSETSVSLSSFVHYSIIPKKGLYQRHWSL